MFIKVSDETYIYGVSQTENKKNVGVEISEQEYNTIMKAIQTPREEPPQGKMWSLLDYTYEYVLIDAPPEEEEATEQDYQAALNAMGVSTDEA